MSNILKTDSGYLCSKCNNSVTSENNYCSNCGLPLSTEATILRSEQDIAVKLETVKELAELTKDPKIIEYLKSFNQ